MGFGLLLVLAVYVLSIGPAKKLAHAGYLPSGFVDGLYQPLRVVDGTPIQSALIWYLQLWFPAKYVGD